MRGTKTGEEGHCAWNLAGRHDLPSLASAQGELHIRNTSLLTSNRVKELASLKSDSPSRMTERISGAPPVRYNYFACVGRMCGQNV